jgi:hypothetical protein
VIDGLGTDALANDAQQFPIQRLPKTHFQTIITAFTHFLTTFVGILNLKEDVFKSDISGTNARKRLRSSFSLVKLPIVQIELIVRALIGVESDEASAPFRQFLLLVLKSTDAIPNDALVRCVLGILRPGLDGDARHKRRVIGLIPNWVKEYEMRYLLGEFGASRHSDKTEEPLMAVYLVDQSNEIVGRLKIRFASSAKVLHPRGALLTNREPNSFILKYQGQRLVQYKKLQDVSVTNKSKIEIHNLPQNHTKSLPSCFHRLRWRMNISRTFSSKS